MSCPSVTLDCSSASKNLPENKKKYPRNKVISVVSVAHTILYSKYTNVLVFL